MQLLKAFWNCGDSQIIEFALLRARLNRHETEVLTLLLDECMTQESAAEKLDISTRCLQNRLLSAMGKLLNIPWVRVYAESLLKKEK